MLVVDKMEVSGKTVRWERDGKKFTSRLMGVSKPIHIDKITERPIVHVSVKFNNMMYGNVPIGLQLEDAASTFLINRDLLTRFKVSVNPNRKFVLSDWSEKGDATDDVN